MSGIDRAIAMAEGKICYTSVCSLHGETLYLTDHGRCVSCLAGEDYSGSAVAALNAGDKFVVGVCPIHGHVKLYARGLRCSLCFTQNGAKRVTGARAIARAAGGKEFPATCAIHGATGHSVAHGKCLQCFTTAGVRRTAQMVDDFRVRLDPAPPSLCRPRVRWPFSTMAVGETVVIDGARAEAARNAARAVSRDGKSFSNMRLRDGPVQFWRVS